MASISLACTPFSKLSKPHKIVLNPTSKWSNLPSKTRINKPSHLNGFRVFAQVERVGRVPAEKIDASNGVDTVLKLGSPGGNIDNKTTEVLDKTTEVDETTEVEEEKPRDYNKVIAENVANASPEVKKAREKREEQWKMALKTLLVQIQSIQVKIETYFMDKPAEAMPMLKILDDVKTLVEIHNANVGLKKHIPTTDAAMKVAHHFQAYKQSQGEDGIIPVNNVKPKKHSFSPMIDMFTELANLLYGQRDVHDFLKGNFAPIREETPPTEIKLVEGQIPSCIRGMLIRNGPNPQFDPVAKYQWMDGDGMLHATYFQDGKVTYASRYIKTSRFLQEKITGRPEFIKFGDCTGAFGVFSAFSQLLKSVFILDMSYGHGVANESIAFHDGVLLALEDFDRPYAINIKKDGDLETMGVYDFKKKLSHNITPHTKKDPRTGELFVFGASYTAPYMTYRVVAPDGSISDPVSIDLLGPTYMHDFGLTENYVIIMDLSFTFSPEAMLKYNDWVYNINPVKKPRFGIRSRDPTESDVEWFELDGGDGAFFIFHNANSWEDEDGNVVLYGCRLGSQKAQNDGIPIIKSVLLLQALVGENLQQIFPELYKFTFYKGKGKVTQERIAENKVDYPKINEKYITRKSRYVYGSEFYDVIGHDDFAKVHSLVKYDLEAEPEKRVTRLEFDANVFGSEVVFVPSNNAIEEDDGYLLHYVHDEKKRKSYVYIICAKTMKREAVLELPKRVPYGFHATFVSEVDLARKKNFETDGKKSGSSKGRICCTCE